MGLRDWAKHRGMKQPVRGALSVRDDYVNGSHIVLTGVLTGEGVPPRAAEVKVPMTHDRWLHAATRDLPVVLDASNPANFTVLWNDVPQITQQQRARAVAEQAAAAAASGAPMPPGLGGIPGLQSDITSGLLRMMGSQGVGGPLPNTTAVSRTSVTVNGVPVDPATAVDVESMVSRLLGAGAGQFVGASATGGLSESLLRQGAGEPAEAVVLAAHDVPEAQWPAGARPPAGYVTFALDVTGADGGTWSATALLGFTTPERKAQAAVVGRSLPVRFDPADRTRVAVDLTRLTL